MNTRSCLPLHRQREVHGRKQDTTRPDISTVVVLRVIKSGIMCDLPTPTFDMTRRNATNLSAGDRPRPIKPTPRIGSYAQN